MNIAYNLQDLWMRPKILKFSMGEHDILHLTIVTHCGSCIKPNNAKIILFQMVVKGSWNGSDLF